MFIFLDIQNDGIPIPCCLRYTVIPNVMLLLVLQGYSYGGQKSLKYETLVNTITSDFKLR